MLEIEGCIGTPRKPECRFLHMQFVANIGRTGRYFETKCWVANQYTLLAKNRRRFGLLNLDLSRLGGMPDLLWI
jgi:hypothetical protein